MNTLALILVIGLLLSCKKEQLKSEVILQNDIINPPILTNDKSTRIDSAVLSSFNSKTLSNFYKSLGYKTVQQSEETRKTILIELLKSGNDGLNPADYAVETLRDFEKNLQR